MGSLPVEDFAEAEKRYEAERAKRLRPDGMAQYLDIGNDEKYKHFAADPLATKDNKYVQQAAPISNGGHSKVLVVGSGFGAITYTVRLIEIAGFKIDDFILVDHSWGFGGTWYWNRYPGLMCDVESACYLPLLEETGYVPKHRYAYGPELRAYSELVAEKWGLDRRALFGSTVTDTAWNDKISQWESTIVRRTIDGKEETLKVTSNFVVLTSGILTRPKLARLPGIETFNGHMFHTSRWDYNYTGGTPENPDLLGLKDKNVALIGTGATGVQAIPQLAKWAGHLYVIQRTPSAVDTRGQRPVDPDQFRREVQTGKGWQRARRENMATFLTNAPNLPTKNLVDDGWTHFPTYSAGIGSLKSQGVTMETVGQYLSYLHELDFPRQSGIRQRTLQLVKDRKTAEALQPWYPGWCKRPCFHDDYLDAFNKPNVELVDTAGKGIDGFNEKGILFGGKVYEADVVIFGTGFEPFSVGSPAFRANMKIKGRNGLSMDDKWEAGPKVFHGVMTRNFPNLLLPGLIQAGATVNFVHTMDVLSSHTAHIIAALRSANGADGKDIVIEPTEEAETAWSLEVAHKALAFAGFAGCTPSYITAEGQGRKIGTPEEALKTALRVAWGLGFIDFIGKVNDWEAQGDLSAFEVTGS